VSASTAPRLARPLVAMVTDRTRYGEVNDETALRHVLEDVRRAARAGVDLIQLRERRIADRDLPVHRANERLHLNAIEVWEWAVAHGVPVSRRLLEDARRTPDRAPALSELLERGGIHRDQDVRGIAGCKNFVTTKIQLKRAHARQRSSRSPNLGRKIRQGTYVVPHQRCSPGELSACKLHTIARIAGQTDDHRFQFFHLFLNRI